VLLVLALDAKEEVNDEAEAKEDGIGYDDAGIVLALLCKRIGVSAKEEDIPNNLCKRGIIEGAAGCVESLSESTSV
jgi:hypothetical protein